MLIIAEQRKSYAGPRTAVTNRRSLSEKIDRKKLSMSPVPEKKEIMTEQDKIAAVREVPKRKSMTQRMSTFFRRLVLLRTIDDYKEL
jgi:hypothetical protein